MAEGGEGEDIELNDFDIDDQYIDDSYNDTNIDRVMNKTDDSFSIQQNIPTTPSIAMKEYNIHETLKKLEEAVKNAGMNLPIKHDNLLMGRIVFKDGNLYLDEQRITSTRGGFKLLAYSTLKNKLNSVNFQELVDVIPDLKPKQTQAPQVPPMDNEPSLIDRQQAQTQTEKVVSKIFNSEGQVKFLLDATLEELEETGLFEPLAIREIKTCQNVVDQLAKEKDDRYQKIEYLEKELVKAIERGNDSEIKRLEDLEKFQREQFEIISQEHKTQIERIKQVWRKVITQPGSQIPLKERIQLLFKIEGITIIAIITAIGMIFTSLGLGIANAIKPTPSPTPSPTPTPSNPNSIPDKVKDGLKQLAKYLWELSKKSAAAIPGIIGAIVSFLLKQMGNAALFLGEHVMLFLFAAVSVIIYGLVDLGRKLLN